MTKWLRVRVATVNDDFTDRKSNIPLVAQYADVILTQENKRDNVRKLVPKGWTSYQVNKNASTKGSAVCWRKSIFRPNYKSFQQIEAARGKGILPRRLTIVHGRVGTCASTFIACHRPLKKTRLQPLFDARLVARCRLLRLRKRYIVVGIDANQRNPRRLARRCGLRWVTSRNSIDGLLVSPGIDVRGVKALPKWTSDHRPIMAWLYFPSK